MKRHMRTIISCLLALALVLPSFGAAAALPGGGVAISAGRARGVDVSNTVTIDNGLVSVVYNLDAGTYEMRDLVRDKAVIKDAYSAMNGEASNAGGYTGSWEQKNVSDELGDGKQLVVTLTKEGALTQKIGFTLYPDDTRIVLSGGIVNTGAEPIQLKTIKPLAGCKAFEGEAINQNLSMLNGYSGAQDTTVQHKGELFSYNNGLITFGEPDSRRSVVLGGLGYNEFVKMVSIAPQYDIDYVDGDPLCYINLGPGYANSTAATGETLSVEKGSTWNYGESTQNVDQFGPHYSSVLFDDNYAVFSLTGLDPNKAYSVGFTFWDVDNNPNATVNRAQSVEAVDGVTGEERQIFEARALNNNRRDEPPQKFTFTLPAGSYANGTAKVKITKTAGYNCVACNAWLLAGETEGGKSVVDVQPLSDREMEYTSVDLQVYADDPYGRRVDAGSEYFPEKDTYYIDYMTSNPFDSLDRYGLSLKAVQHADPSRHDFPSVCLWYAALYDVAGGGKVNTTQGAVDVMQGIADSGFLKYSPAAVRLVPDYYGINGAGGNLQQGWWDDEHWRMYSVSSDGNGLYTEPYETTEKWAGAVHDLGGIPLTYFQTSVMSADYAEQYPEHTLFNEGNYHDGVWLNDSYQPNIGYDFTDPGFQAHMREVYDNLREGGVEGLMFDYPGTAWDTQGGFEDPYATTAVNYKNAFKLAKEGMGPDSYIDERGIETGYDITLGIVDSQRTEGDTADLRENMVTKAGLRWYKNRVVTNYDLDSKDLMRATSTDELNTNVTMSYIISGRLLLANDFRAMSDEALYALTRTYPQHTEAKSHRPVDAFVNPDYPQVYDFEITPDWHQVTFYNGDFNKSDRVGTDLSGDTALGGLGLDPNAEYYVYDFWNNTYVGKLKGTDRLEQTLRKGETRVLSVKKAEPNPQLVSTDRHIFQGYLDTENVKWENDTLSGTSKVIGGDTYRAYIKLPDGAAYTIGEVTASGGATASVEVNPYEKLAVLTLDVEENTDVDWSVQMTPSEVEAETNPPSAVTGLTGAYNEETFNVELGWDASTDDSGRVRYQVSRSDSPDFAPESTDLLAKTEETSYADADVRNGTTYYYQVVAEDIWGNRTEPAQVEVTVDFEYPVQFLEMDNETQGRWIGSYGAGGYYLPSFDGVDEDRVKLPSYIDAVTIDGTGWQASGVWPQFPLDPDDPETCKGGMIFRNNMLTLDIKANDSERHTVSLYMFDNDNNRRVMVYAEDDKGHVISPEVAVDDFRAGSYLTFSFQNSVKFRLKVVEGANAVLSGIFFDDEGGDIPSGVDKSFLEKLIAAIDGKYDAERYTEESFAALTEALDAAKAVVEDKAAAQADVYEAYLNLVKARDGLVYEVDTSMLELAVALAKETVEKGNLTPSAAEALESAIEAAEALLGSGELTQEAVDEMYVAVMTAIVESVEQADREDLEKLIGAVKDFKEENYTPESWGPFAESLKAAKETAADLEADQAAVDAAYRDLMEKNTALVRRANFEALQGAVDTAEEILADPAYDETTLGNLAELVSEAKNLIAEANAEQAEVNALGRELAIETAKVRLLQAVGQAAALNAEDYTEASWNAVDAALEAAEAVLGDETADETALAEQEMQLRTALAGLELVETPDPDPKPSKPSNSKGGNTSAVSDSDYWSEVIEKINGTEKGGKVNAKLDEGAMVPATVIDALKNKGVTVAFEIGGKDYAVNGAGELKGYSAAAVYYTSDEIKAMAGGSATEAAPTASSSAAPEASNETAAVNPETGGEVPAAVAPTAPEATVPVEPVAPEAPAVIEPAVPAEPEAPAAQAEAPVEAAEAGMPVWAVVVMAIAAAAIGGTALVVMLRKRD